MSGPADSSREPLRLSGFRTFWMASTLGFVGMSVSALAADVLVIQELHASEIEVGVVRAAQFAPYLLVGLVAGVLVDRWRRRPTLIVRNLAQGLLLLLLPVMWWLDVLTVWVVAGVLLIAGSFAVFAAAAAQSLLPDLVPRHCLVVANARTLAFVCAAQLLYGFAMGLEDPNEMGYWQAVTPRDMLGRVNATRRSVNRSTAVVGALLGGLVAAALGYRGTLIGVAAVFLVASLVAALSPLRGART